MKVQCCHSDKVREFNKINNYLWDTTKRDPSNWKQLCKGGGHKGSTIMSHNDKWQSKIVKWLENQTDRGPFGKCCPICNEQIDEKTEVKDIINILQ